MFSLFCSLLVVIASSFNCDPECDSESTCMKQTADVTGPDINNPTTTQTVSSTTYQCVPTTLCEILEIDQACKSAEFTIYLPVIYPLPTTTCEADPTTYPVPISLVTELTCSETVVCSNDEIWVSAFTDLATCYLPDEVVTAIQCNTGDDCPQAVTHHFKKEYAECACNTLYLQLLLKETGEEYIPVVNNWITSYIDSTLSAISSHYSSCVIPELDCDLKISDCERPNIHANPLTNSGHGNGHKCDEVDTYEEPYIEASVVVNVCVIDDLFSRLSIYNILHAGIVATFAFDGTVVIQLAFNADLVVVLQYSAEEITDGGMSVGDVCEFAHKISATLRVYWADMEELGKFYYTMLAPILEDVEDAVDGDIDTFSVRFGGMLLEGSVGEGGAAIEGFGAVQVVDHSVEIYAADGSVYDEPEEGYQGNGAFCYSFVGIFAFFVVVIALN